jgi:hypothetical protein
MSFPINTNRIYNIERENNLLDSYLESVYKVSAWIKMLWCKVCEVAEFTWQADIMDRHYLGLLNLIREPPISEKALPVINARVLNPPLALIIL